MSGGVITLPTDKYIYSYPTNQVNTIHQQWKSASDEWVNYGQQLKSFDTENNLLEHIYQNWNTTINDWLGYLRIVYFWSDEEAAFTLKIQKTTKEITTNIFPIPAKNNLNINFSEKTNSSSTLLFYDLNGKEILKKYISPNTQNIALKLPNYNGSVLFLKIKNEKGISTYKVLLDK
jgi:hypothetical protein